MRSSDLADAMMGTTRVVVNTLTDNIDARIEAPALRM